ncbi:hypothetical protein RND71_037071 [Anisodus tanguticus]|uniref:Uncharacterized protein n=1 Tax=Anisodus tanguticus TaxID=243964 RepID=A0AAE1R4V5_9SOLA|nr:hypothetical protein RND71_037071 [Anisodus tanguticus]
MAKMEIMMMIHILKSLVPQEGTEDGDGNDDDNDDTSVEKLMTDSEQKSKQLHDQNVESSTAVPSNTIFCQFFLCYC